MKIQITGPGTVHPVYIDDFRDDDTPYDPYDRAALDPDPVYDEVAEDTLVDMREYFAGVTFHDGEVLFPVLRTEFGVGA